MDTLLSRFLRYVAIDTQSDDTSKTSPSSSRQLVLSSLLKKECEALKLSDVAAAPNGIVTATIPATDPQATETIVWIAHMDTSPEYSGAHVNPIVHENYKGGDIVLPCSPSKTITVTENPELHALIGTTIVTTDGTTLLGADDKAGIAVIMTAATYLQEHRDIFHGPIKICFTVDEEIGRGTHGLDVAQFKAVCGYTIDGGGLGSIDNETFSADMATITVKGVNSHPSEAKAKGMVNAIRILSKLLTLLPTDHLAPEVTDERDGFLHPYNIEGGVAQATAKIILRDFNADKLSEYVKFLEGLKQQVLKEYPKATIDIEIRRQYRNMRSGLDKEPRAVEYAVKAMRNLGIEPEIKAIRGGTDGSLITEQGLPCPNLFSGQHNLHSPLEWASLYEMEKAVDVLVELARLFCHKISQR